MSIYLAIYLSIYLSSYSIYLDIYMYHHYHGIQIDLGKTKNKENTMHSPKPIVDDWELGRAMFDTLHQISDLLNWWKKPLEYPCIAYNEVVLSIQSLRQQTSPFLLIKSLLTHSLSSQFPAKLPLRGLCPSSCRCRPRGRLQHLGCFQQNGTPN